MIQIRSAICDSGAGISDSRGGDRGGSVGHSNWAHNILNHGADSSVSVTLCSAVGEVASQTVGFDDGTVEAGSTDQGCGSSNITTTHCTQHSS